MAISIELKGISKRGRHLVKTWGRIWYILKREEHVQFSNVKGNWILIEPMYNNEIDSLRWIHLFSDKDFEIIKLYYENSQTIT